MRERVECGGGGGGCDGLRGPHQEGDALPRVPPLRQVVAEPGDGESRDPGDQGGAPPGGRAKHGAGGERGEEGGAVAVGCHRATHARLRGGVAQGYERVSRGGGRRRPTQQAGRVAEVGAATREGVEQRVDTEAARLSRHAEPLRGAPHTPQGEAWVRLGVSVCVGDGCGADAGQVRGKCGEVWGKCGVGKRKKEGGDETGTGTEGHRTGGVGVAGVRAQPVAKAAVRVVAVRRVQHLREQHLEAAGRDRGAHPRIHARRPRRHVRRATRRHRVSSVAIHACHPTPASLL